MKKTKLTRSLMAAVSIVALSAVMYGCVHSGGDPVEVEAPNLEPARSAAAAAEMAAMTASDAAAAAVAAVDAIRSLDAVAFLRAENAAAAAKAASDDAAAASADAAAATTLEDAEAAQAAAAAAQAAAEAAQADAVRNAGIVQAIKDANDQAEADRIAAEEEAARLAAEAEAARIAAEEEAARIAAEEATAAEAEAARIAAEEAAAELAALAAARTAADEAADAAEMSARDAAAAVAAADDGADADMASYASAQAAATAAMTAATAAREASDEAARATTSADAATHQATAEEQQGAAATALGNAMSYAGMVATAKAAADEAAAEATALMTAKDAAQAAHDAAMKSSTDASAAVEAVAGSKNLTVTAAAAYARAEDAAADAAEALLDAIAANAKAQAAMTSEEAAMHQADAEAAMRAAGIAYTSAKGFVAVVTEQARLIRSAAREADMLDTAQKAANDAATAARTAADAAQVAADKIAELAGAGSAAAISAQTLADEAEAAAVAAETAALNADADTSSEDAGLEQVAAEGGKMTAEGNLAILVDRQADAQVAYDATRKQLRAQALEDAQEATQEAADEAADHLTAVQGKAADARNQASAARRAANAAKAARQDYENADKYAKMAEAEATKAEAALARAMQANTDAQAALTAANAATTPEAAEAEEAKAKAANDIATEAHTGDTGAGMAYMAAKSAAEKAVEAAGDNVLGLFSLLNGDDTETAAARTARLAAINTLLSGNAQGDPVTTGLGTTAGNSSTPATVATVTWPYHGDLGDNGTPDPAGTTGINADTEPGEGMIDIMLDTTPALNLTRDDEDEITGGTDETNFVKGPGLGDFAEYHITVGAGAEAKARTIVFTDKEQAGAPTPASQLTFANRVPVASQIEDFGDGTANSGRYDHDGNADTTAIEVTFACPDGATCDVVEDANGDVTSITGYRMSTVAAGVTIAATAESEDTTYLAFGAWVAQAAGADGAVTFGAFANGFADNGNNNQAMSGAPITGTATYNGSAAGVHNTPDGTNFFHADAILTADFGDAAALGTITGRISNIMSGGNAVSHSIYLDRAVGATDDQNIVEAGTFDGRARMGAAVANPQTGVVSYPYEGLWSGRFYNDAPAVPANQAPLSAAGTFGVQNTDHMGTADDSSDDETSSFIGAFGAHRD